MSIRIHRVVAGLLATSLLVACGGGGGGGSTGPTQPTPPADPTWTADQYASPTMFQAYCASPRSGTDPVTGQAYPDRLGSVGWENNWIRAWTHAYYLWNTEVTDQDPESFTTANYFQLMKTMATTSSGAAKDRFHFTYDTTQWEQLSQSDVNVGYGANWVLLAAYPPRNVVIAYVDAFTDTTNTTQSPAAKASLARGAKIIQIDGVDMINANDAASIATLNAGLAPATVGESHTFVVEDTPGGAQRTITMVSANISENPVPLVTSVATGHGPVGYIEFNAHVATAESGLIAAMNRLIAANITDLVIDIRYNGGGYLDIASELAYMVAGPGPTASPAFFEQETFNSQYGATNPFTNSPSVTPFWSTTQGFSATAGTALPSLNLARVFVLTSNSTCSASEAIINGLRGVGITVIEIGTTTCGKPYGFYPQDNCGTTYFSIQFQGNNNAGFGSYGDGFTPSNSPAGTAGYPIPGCEVGDDFTHALGDPAEAELAAALGYAAGAGTCPAPSSFAPAQPLVSHYLVRPEPLTNRILRRPK